MSSCIHAVALVVVPHAVALGSGHCSLGCSSLHFHCCLHPDICCIAVDSFGHLVSASLSVAYISLATVV